MTIKDLLNRAVYKLKDAKIDQPILKARIEHCIKQVNNKVYQQY